MNKLPYFIFYSTLYKQVPSLSGGYPETLAKFFSQRWGILGQVISVFSQKKRARTYIWQTWKKIRETSKHQSYVFLLERYDKAAESGTAAGTTIRQSPLNHLPKKAAPRVLLLLPRWRELNRKPRDSRARKYINLLLREIELSRAKRFCFSTSLPDYLSPLITAPPLTWLKTLSSLSRMKPYFMTSFVSL